MRVRGACCLCRICTDHKRGINKRKNVEHYAPQKGTFTVLKSNNKFYLLSLAGVVAASAYPLYMGIKVVSDMIRFGTVYAESYPKYIIPYTPIALALIIGTALLPLMFRLAKRFALLAGSAVSLGVFLASELLLESRVIVTTTFKTTLESWQMFMCYVPPEGFPSRTWTEVDVLMGEYSPAFKIHFYFISVILIVSLLNCIYGFAKMIQSDDKSRKRALIIQSAASLTFLGLCILACFTAFYRTGDITVLPLSAFLMILFFVVMGLTAGVFAGSFLLGKRKLISCLIPAVIASAVTTVMYIGEMILLSGNLYRFGDGFFFSALGTLVLAPVDICVIILSGSVCYLITSLLSVKRQI